MKYRISPRLGVLTLLTFATSVNSQSAPSNTPAIESTRSARWADATPLKDSLPTNISSLIRSQDVLAYAAPGALYPVRNIGLQCQGVNATLADVPKRVATVSTIDGVTEARFGETIVDGVRVFRLEATARDALPVGASARCELVSYPTLGSALPIGERVWFAFSFWADDWAGTRDEQLIAQMHVQEPRNILLNPFFALVVHGAELRVELRYNIQTIPDKDSTNLVTAARLEMPTRQWVTAVVESRISSRPEHAPFFRMWLNGKQVVDYSGPLGYVLPPGGYAYPKVGIYHWLSGNPWDLKVPIRALLVGAMITVHDSAERYTQGLLQAAVARPAPR